MPRGFRYDRYRLRVSIGNLFEIIAAAMCCTGVYLLAGLGWTLVAGSIAIIIAAEMLYSNTIVRVPLPRVPQRRHPIQVLKQGVHKPLLYWGQAKRRFHR